MVPSLRPSYSREQCKSSNAAFRKTLSVSVRAMGFDRPYLRMIARKQGTKAKGETAHVRVDSIRRP